MSELTAFYQKQASYARIRAMLRPNRNGAKLQPKPATQPRGKQRRGPR